MRYSNESTEGQFLAGDPAAVGTVTRWIAMVLTSSRFQRLRRDWSDLHQEAMLRVVESLKKERFDPARDLRVYVQAITRYTAHRALLDLPPAPVPDPGRTLENAGSIHEGRALNARILAGQILARLSDPCRLVLSLYFFDQRSLDEIGAELGVPVGTVKSRLFRCIEAAHHVVERWKKREPKRL